MKTLIEWRDSFNTGIPGVDHEHQELIRQINEIYRLIDSRSGKEDVLDGLGDIYGSISAHFALEERMMQSRNYDHYAEHKADHDRLLDEICEITELFERDSRLDDRAFKETLNDWFQLHFKAHDSGLHILAGLPAHDPIDDSALMTMIRNAKNTFLERVGRH